MIWIRKNFCCLLFFMLITVVLNVNIFYVSGSSTFSSTSTSLNKNLSEQMLKNNYNQWVYNYLII
jgi:hypothetical protein